MPGIHPSLLKERGFRGLLLPCLWFATTPLKRSYKSMTQPIPGLTPLTLVPKAVYFPPPQSLELSLTIPSIENTFVPP